MKVGFDLLDGYDEYDEIDDERDHTEYLIPRKELTYLLERWLAFILKPIIEPNYIEIVDSIEFGYCDSSGKLAPRCVAKDSSDNARRAIATYILTLNDIDIVRLVLDDLKIQNSHGNISARKLLMPLSIIIGLNWVSIF